MPQSLAQLYVHLVFSTKERVALIPITAQPGLHAYLAGILNSIDCPAIQVGGVADHVHLLFRLSKNRALADAARHTKVESSKWMKDRSGVRMFAWQAGYGAFSVSASHVDSVADYIRNQAEHHRSRSFKDEFRTLLKRYNLKFDEACMWD